MKKTAYCKINLTLEILGTRRADGFHDIKSIMHKIPLGDEIELYVDKASKGIVFECDSDICAPKENLAFRAAQDYLELYTKNTSLTCGVIIKLKKITPSGAGLGGGSADAACVLDMLQSLLGGVGDEELLLIAAGLGSDVVFCLDRYTCALCTGRGEICESISHLPSHVSLCVAKPYESLNTKGIYASYDGLFGEDYSKDNSDKMKYALKIKDVSLIKELVCNDFEPVCIPRLSQIVLLKQSFLQNGAEFSLMSGSGSAVYGIFTDDLLCKKCKETLEKQGECEVFAFTSGDFEKMYKGE